MNIFNKDNEKIINEELLYIICVNLDNEVELDNDSIILKIKEKLKIKKSLQKIESKGKKISENIEKKTDKKKPLTTKKK